MQPLIEEASKKAAVAWLTVPGGGAPYLVWCGWIEDALYVVGGSGEQETPGLAEAAEARAPGVRVTLRGDHGGRVVTWDAEVLRLVPGTEDWQAVAVQVAGKRLNASGDAAQTVQRWTETCHLYRLRPTGEAAEAGPTLPDTDLVAEARRTAATRPVKRPFRLHRVRRR